jgi:hypothetical protein
MEFIDLPLRRHDCRCVHSRMNRRSPFGPGLPHPVLVPSLPFLPASTVSSAARRGPKTSSLGSSQVCCTLQPTVGSTSFRVLSDPKIPSHDRLGVARIREPFPEVQTLRSVLLPGSSLPSPRSPAFTRKRCPLAVGPFTRVATDDRLIPRPQGFAPPGSPFSRRNVSATLRVDAPMGFWIDTLLPATRFRDGRDQVLALSVRRSKPPHRSRGPSAWEGKVSRLCLAPTRPLSTVAPEGAPTKWHDPLATRRLLRFRAAPCLAARGGIWTRWARPEGRTKSPITVTPRGGGDATWDPEGPHGERSLRRGCPDSRKSRGARNDRAARLRPDRHRLHRSGTGPEPPWRPEGRHADVDASGTRPKPRGPPEWDPPPVAEATGLTQHRSAGSRAGKPVGSMKSNVSMFTSKSVS